MSHGAADKLPRLRTEKESAGGQIVYADRSLRPEAEAGYFWVPAGAEPEVNDLGDNPAAGDLEELDAVDRIDADPRGTTGHTVRAAWVELAAKVQDGVGDGILDERGTINPLHLREGLRKQGSGITDTLADVDRREVVIPAVVAEHGRPAAAIYLVAHGWDLRRVSKYLGVGERTVSQYLSDYKRGER